jgi:4-hydroxy-4-methyl-2-oxoglutarate aldolase
VAKEEQTRKALAEGQLGLDLYGLRAKLAALGVEYVEYVSRPNSMDVTS